MMKKIRCPRCGVINLEKFVTYPHCAGCGSMLPQAAEATESLPIWRRPLGPLLWVSVIAGAVAGLVVAATMFEKEPVEVGRVVVYGRAARRMTVNDELTINLTLDAFNTGSMQEDDLLKDVSIRLSRATLEKFEFISVSPPPDVVMRSGTGRYLQYNAIPRETQIQLTIRPREPGTHSISIGVFARDHFPSVPYNVTVRVAPIEKHVEPASRRMVR
jgi:hypothetical protein